MCAFLAGSTIAGSASFGSIGSCSRSPTDAQSLGCIHRSVCFGGVVHSPSLLEDGVVGTVAGSLMLGSGCYRLDVAASLRRHMSLAGRGGA